MSRRKSTLGTAALIAFLAGAAQSAQATPITISFAGGSSPALFEYVEQEMVFVTSGPIAMATLLSPTLTPTGLENPHGQIGFGFINSGKTFKLDSITFSGNSEGGGLSELWGVAKDGKRLKTIFLDDTPQTIDFSNDPLWSDLYLVHWCTNSLMCGFSDSIDLAEYQDKNAIINVVFQDPDLTGTLPTSTAVPEPYTWPIMLAGLLAFGATMRHRRKATA